MPNPIPATRSTVQTPVPNRRSEPVRQPAARPQAVSPISVVNTPAVRLNIKPPADPASPPAASKSPVPPQPAPARRKPRVAARRVRPQGQAPRPGEPLSDELQASFSQSFDADLSAVRIHTDSSAQAMAKNMSARAFTYGSHIFLGPGEQANDTRLIAHELTHVLQQSSRPAVQRWVIKAGGSDLHEREARQAGDIAAQGGKVSVREHVSSPRVQRWGISDAIDYIADAANNIPGFSMLTYVLGVNPVNMRSVERNATNLFRAIIGFMPGGDLVFRALQNHGILDRVGSWVQQQLATLGIVGSSLRSALDRFLDSLSWSDIFDLGGVWERAKRIFTEPIDRFISFIGGLVRDIIKFIRDAILRPVARLAEGTRGYDLLRFVLGFDPITNDPYPRTPENFIGGFMRLIGQEEKWRYLQESRAIPRAWAWFQQQLGTLMGFVSQIPGLFVQLWDLLEISDLLDIGSAFNKIRTVFGGFISNFISWAGNAALQIMEFILEALAPGAMPILRRAASVIRTIVRNPIGFVVNLVNAGKRGFQQFAANIRTHLINGLVGWITGALSGAGLTLPSRWDMRGILSLVLQILGLTWANVRQKLVRVMGDTAVRALETGFQLVVTLVREGPAAAWQQILQHVQNLQETVMGGIRDWVIRTVVQQAVMRIASMLNPAGAVIQAIIAIYNTIMFFRERLQQIMQVAEAFFSSVAAIASGNIGAAASFVERTMARLVPVVISFLARLIGLGGISDTIRNIIARIRAPIDRAIDRVIEWIVRQTSAILARLGSATAAPTGPDNRSLEQKNADLRVAVREAGTVLDNRQTSRRQKVLALDAIKTRYRLRELALVSDTQTPQTERVHVRGVINPTYDGDGRIIDRFPPEPRVIIETMVGAPQGRQGFEEVLEPSPAGFQRAHLVGAGFGVESPLGVFHAPTRVNQELQNRGIEQFIRGMYRNRYPGVEFFVRADAEPHPGTDFLARVTYNLYGQKPGEPRAHLLEIVIRVSNSTTNPVVRVRQGESDPAAMSSYSSFVQQRLRRLRID